MKNEKTSNDHFVLISFSSIILWGIYFDCSCNVMLDTLMFLLRVGDASACIHNNAGHCTQTLCCTVLWDSTELDRIHHLLENTH